MSTHELFFPRLIRRNQYRTTRSGEYYADYSEYKQEIREDCLGRCVYCDCHENELGGPESMNLDHFRPKKYKDFEHLINDPHNLVWTCGGCNKLKLHHWPALGTIGTVLGENGFIDPFLENRLEYFEIRQDGELIPLKPPAAYMEKLLVLNRLTSKLRRQWRYQAHELIPKLIIEITKLEQLTDLTDEQARLLEILKSSRAMQQARLDFSLHDS
ncbi:MAG: HNH endonuclease signature motif containing protein [Anaerolineae bacterium]